MTKKETENTEVKTENTEVKTEKIDTLNNLINNRKLKSIEELAIYIEDLEREIIILNNTIGIFRNALKNKE